MPTYLTPDEGKFGLAVVRWVSIRREWREKPGWEPSQADVMKSALLARIREGGRVFKRPPPLCYSYPWYDIIDKGAAWFHSSWPVLHKGEGAVVSLCQGPGWVRIHDGDDGITLTYTGEDRWLYRWVRDSEPKVKVGVSVGEANGERSPLYADHVIERLDQEAVW